MGKVSLDVLEDTMLTSVERLAASETTDTTDGYTNDLVNRVATTIPEVLQSILRHPNESVLATESDWLLQKLTEYGSIQGEERMVKREKWLTTHLPAILRKLLHNHGCPFMDCPSQITMPNKETLEKWTEINSVGEVRLHILAYYHGCTYAVIKERFHRRTPRRISERKPPTAQ